MYCLDPASGSYSRANGLLLDGAQIASTDPDAAGAGIETIDLAGATVLPAFGDAHVHLTDTGLFLEQWYLGATRSYADLDAAVARISKAPYVLAGQYDESFWNDARTADASILERHLPDAYAMLVRVDGHSCIVNRRTFAWLNLPPGLQGIERGEDGEPTGKLFLDANWRAQSTFMKRMPLSAKRVAERRAAELAVRRGYLHLHVQLVGFERAEYAAEIEALHALPGVKVYPKICEPDPQLAQELGLPYIGGDVFLDGSIGSCTAAVSEPFCGNGSRGELRYSDDQVHAYFANAEALGISAGVHAIGDRAIEQCIAAWESVLGGKPSTRGNRHFIEHFEIAKTEHIEACARMEIYLSMQPQFDALWGGTGNMYDARLGTQRMRTMNALGRIAASGATLCGGDDSPVCSFSPLEGIGAAVNHHETAERLSLAQAVTMYTYNVARLSHAETKTGRIAPGYAADLVILDRDPFNGAAPADCSVLATYRDGTLVFPLSC
ncbi:MAG: amidohydrolase [Candidatus Baltobacteraceae bacterium]